jgi:hypothetical protein
MDPLSITVGCVSLASSIGKTLAAISTFVREFRAARHDLDVASRELISLDGVVMLLKEDCGSQDHGDGGIPKALQTQIRNILENCTLIVCDLQDLLQKHNSTKLGKGTLWMTSGKGDVAKLKSTLEAHRGALSLAIDLVAV